MAYENSGRLFKNEHKDLNDPNDKRPNYTGDFTDEHGKKWRCAAWIKPGDKGKWMSFKVSEAQQQESAAPAPPADVDDSEIPF